MEISKEQRAEYFDRKCRESGYRDWGKTQNLARDLNVTHGQVSNWLNGAVPRGFDEIWRVAQHLNIDIMEWIYGVDAKSDVLDENKLTGTFRLLKAIEKGENYEMSPSQFARFAILVYNDDMQSTAMISKIGQELSGEDGAGGTAVNGD